MTLLLSLVLGCNSWGQGPHMPMEVQRVLKIQIHKDLQDRAIRLRSRIENTEIQFDEAVLLPKKEHQLTYVVRFNEISSEELRSQQQIRKILLFDKSWRLLKIIPQDQEIRIQEGAEVSI